MAEQIAIVGGGAIATGLACVAASGAPVTLWARRPDVAAASLREVFERIGRTDIDRVRVTGELSELADATFAIEAISEDRAVKIGLLEQIDGLLAPASILATTTSSLSVGELAQASGRPDRFVGLHVFNPVARMELIELVFPPAARPDVRERARALCSALGKRAVEVPDTPGFVVNRLLFPYLFDAVRLHEQTGLDPAAIDACMCLGAAYPIGPLALIDLVGLDVAAAIGESLALELPARVADLIAQGALGRKSGRGFYDYDNV